MRSTPGKYFLINIVGFIVAYYISILLHEWGHGTLAWLFSVKKNPFDIQYGGWLLGNVDENVDYASLIISNRGVAAALIGIAGVSVSFLLAIVSFFLLANKDIQKETVKFTFVYWFLMINMVPLIQYLTVSTFSLEGDVGQFIHGLNISPWLIFIPGTLFNIFALWRILKIEIPKSYVVMQIRSIFVQNIFLLLSLGVMFLFIYTHGYNPLTDKGMTAFGKTLAILSILLVPVLFILCNPYRYWVKNAIAIYRDKLEQ